MTSEFSAPAGTGPSFDRTSEVFLALVTRWRTDRNQLGLGVSYRQLADAIGNESELHDALQELRGRLVGLGLELIEYRLDGDTWMCLRSLHVAPTELDDTQQGVLGTAIYLLEQAAAEKEAADASTADGDTAGAAATPPSRSRRNRNLDGQLAHIQTAQLAETLVGGTTGGYLSKGRYDDALGALEQLGYLSRRGRKLQYGPRTLIEFPDEAREAIAQQAARLIT